MSQFLTTDELTDLRGSYILELADRDGDGNPDAGVVDAAIDGAETEVLEILNAERYRLEDIPATPETAVPGLKDAVADMVPFHVLKGTGAQISEQTLTLYKEAKARVRTIGRGGGSLLLPGQPKVDNSRPTIRIVGVRTDRLTLEALEDW